MEVKEILENYDITQQQLADFTGIPRDRIAKWVQQNKQPPKAADINLLDIAVNYFTSISGNVKDLIDLYIIRAGKVVPRTPGIDPVIYDTSSSDSSIVSEAFIPYNVGKTTPPAQSSLDQFMSALQQLIASNNELVRSNSILVNTNAQLVNKLNL